MNYISVLVSTTLPDEFGLTSILFFALQQVKLKEQSDQSTEYFDRPPVRFHVRYNS